MTLAFIRHKTWITVNQRQYASRLLNQYDLAEVIEGAHEAADPGPTTACLSPLALGAIEHEQGVVWHDSPTWPTPTPPATTSPSRSTPTPSTPTSSPNAIQWMVANTAAGPVARAARPATNPSPSTKPAWNSPMSVGPSEIDPNDDRRLIPAPSTRAEFAGSSAISRCCLDTFATPMPSSTALVVDYGLVKLGREAARLRPFRGKLRARLGHRHLGHAS